MIAKHFNVSRGTIRKHLIQAEISLRNQSEAEKLKWAKMSDEQRANQVKSAHLSNIGRIHSKITRVAAAINREKHFNEYHVGIGETEFRQFLIDQSVLSSVKRL